MVVLIVGYLCWGRWYFLYYSYCRKSTGQEFFVPTQTFIAVKLLMVVMLSKILIRKKMHYVSAHNLIVDLGRTKDRIIRT